MMVGCMNWLVMLGRYDIQYTTNSLARYMMAPREGHMNAMKRLFNYIHGYPKVAIKYDPAMPEWIVPDENPYDWEPQYGKVVEETPPGMPVPLGRPVRTGGFFDSDHAGCLETRRSTAASILYVNKTPVMFYSKRQATVESSAWSSEIVAARLVGEQAIDLRYRLRMLGVQVIGPTVLFGDNQGVMYNISQPHSTLKKRHQAVAYH